MKQTILIILLTGCVLSLHAQYFIEDTSISTEEQIEYFDNGNIKRTYHYDEEGRLNGPWKSYYENGQAEKTGTYKSGIPVGEWETYRINGMIWKKYFYEGQKNQFKEIIIYHDNGNVAVKQEYNETGGLAVNQDYDLNGNIIEEIGTGTYKWQNYHEGGCVKRTEEYLNGQKNGEWKYFNYCGILSCIETNDNGKTLSQTYFYEDGKIEKLQLYNNNILTESKEYFENGQLCSIKTYIDGYNDGEWKWYYENGQLLSIQEFEKNRKVGEWKWYYENGQLKNITNWRKGRSLYYDENGNLLKKEKF